VLELLWLAKSTSRDEVTLVSEEIKPVAIAIIKLRLSGGISQSVGWSVSIKFHLIRNFKHINLVGCKVDLKTFLS